MTPGRPSWLPGRAALVLTILLPVLTLAGFRLAGLHPSFRLDDARRLAERAGAREDAFTALLVEARAHAERALAGPAAAARPAAATPLASRLDGVALLDPALGHLTWEGTPAAPPASFADADAPQWTIRVEGVRTRLLARGGPDEDGRAGLASFVVDSILDDGRFLDLLPAAVRRGMQIDVVFVDTAARRELERRGDDALEPVRAALQRELPERRIVELGDPSGEILAVAALLPVPPAVRLERLHARGRAAALTALLVLAACTFPWRRIAQAGAAGLGVAAAALVAARGLLVWQEAPARLLPRSLGAPGLYGSPAPGGLLASPADLLLTAGAIFLLARAVARFAATRRSGARLATLAGAVLTSGAALAVTLSLARNSRLALLDRPAPFEWNARLVLWLGLALVLIASAELWARLAALGDRDAAAAPRAPGRLRVGVAFVLVALLTGAALLVDTLDRRMALEQLGHEFAPQVLEQSARRRVALKTALRELRESYRLGDMLREPRTFQTAFLAYRYWVGGELFHSRYKSSLDFYDPEGRPLSHFAFDLPPFAESSGILEPPDERLEIEEESFPLGLSETRRVLHGAVAVVRGGKTLAIAVAHVLDEPENLPFLPWSEPYLAALGPAAPREFAGGPQYVLFDALGSVVLSTVRQPPVAGPSLRRAAERGETVDLEAGGEPFVGLPLAEPDGRLHLLLLEERSGLERLAALVRLVLFGLVLVCALSVSWKDVRPSRARALVGSIRRSFQRKLVAALLVASAVPLVGLALFLRGYVERRAGTELVSSADQFVGAARQVVQDFSAEAAAEGEEALPLDDALLYWLRRVVGQEIHVYDGGTLAASSKRELFASGLLPERLDGRVHRALFREGLPLVVASTAIGPSRVPVAYGPVRTDAEPARQMAVAVPLVGEQREIAEATARIADMILLATVALVGLLGAVATVLARAVARPVRELVGAAGQIAAGEYSTRLEPRTRDEVAELVNGFNTMARALARQRADIERRRDYIETLLRHATTGVVSLDAAGRIVTLNPAAAALLRDCAGGLAVGRELLEVLAAADALRPVARALDERRADGEPVEVDVPGDGGRRRLRVVRVGLRKTSGEGFGTLVLIDDVTDLMRSNQLAAWAEMARSIAHEIKNPLTPIQLSTEHLRRLLRDRGVLPSPEEEACLETIINQVRALYEIAGEFSAYAKLPALAPEPTDPVAFMRGVIDPYRTGHPQGVVIEERYEPSPAISIDRKVLGRAIVNLVENGLQAMGPRGTLTLGVRPAERNGAVELSVTDTGPGLDPEVQRHLFEPYFSTKSSGTGLGLAIVRQAVEAHDGRIHVHSRKRHGTTFTLRLPAAAPLAS
jgi:signal transduction histidine kinase